jgi:hypothetical protein
MDLQILKKKLDDVIHMSSSSMKKEIIKNIGNESESFISDIIISIKKDLKKYSNEEKALLFESYCITFLLLGLKLNKLNLQKEKDILDINNELEFL